MATEGYDFEAMQRRWQPVWQSLDLFTPRGVGERRYVVDMFAYPSGDLHMGHAEAYAFGDAIARYWIQRGYDVLHPIGWDSFGLPAENAAIKRKQHPADWTYANIATQADSFRRYAVSVDWRTRLHTSDPSYYRWTQWLFLRFFERGLAYRARSAVNWCPVDQTVLANEQVIAGRCERCGTEVVHRELTQWFFRITSYADRLLDDMDALTGRWPAPVLTMQRNWIGRSRGAYVDFPVLSDPSGSPRDDPSGPLPGPLPRHPSGPLPGHSSGDLSGHSSGESSGTVPDADRAVTVFTTRPDTVLGATFLVVAPDSPLAAELCAPSRRSALEAYAAAAKQAGDADRAATGRSKTGVPLGRDARHPFTGARMPIWAADYVLPGYGTGAIMAVPARDDRDRAFAETFGLPIVEAPMLGDSSFAEAAGPGSPEESAVDRAIAVVEAAGAGRGGVSYRLRDWLVSRQRFWGCPIPIVHCPGCGEVPVPDDQLPVTLPDMRGAELAPRGESPLAANREWASVPCPRCGLPASRDTDTMDTFVDSSWYFLRYPSVDYTGGPLDPEATRRWLPVDRYIGGEEHAILHLLYTRFFTKVLHDMGLVGFNEPFRALLNQGQVILDGSAMSKSKGNLVDLGDQLTTYGVDAVRLTMVFAGPPEDDIDWADVSPSGAVRFLSRALRLADDVSSPPSAGPTATAPPDPAGADPHNGAAPEGDTRPDDRATAKSATRPHRRAAAEDATRRHHRAAAQGETGPHEGALDRRDVADLALRRTTHRLLREITALVEAHRFNVAVARTMQLVNAARKAIDDGGAASSAVRETVEVVAVVLSLFTPYTAEEMWSRLGHEPGIARAGWPAIDPALAAEQTIVCAVQINGKLRDRLEVPADITEDALTARALASPAVIAAVSGRPIARTIVRPPRLVNLVVPSA